MLQGAAGQLLETADAIAHRIRVHAELLRCALHRCGLDIAVPLDEQLDTLAELCKRGYADRLMLSHDKSSFMDWFTDVEIDAFVPNWQYTYIHSGVLPGLRERGVTDDQIEQILMRNPRDFFAQQGTYTAPKEATSGDRSAV